MVGPSENTYTQQVSIDEKGSAVVLIPSKNTQTAGTYRVSVASQSSSFTVIADRADDAHSSFSVSPAVIKASSKDTTTVTVLLRDRFSNPIIGRPMGLFSDRLTDDISARSVQTDDNGQFLWSVTSSVTGNMTLIPYDIVSGKQLKLRATVTVTGGNSFLGSMLSGREQGGEDTPNADTSVVDRLELTLPQGALSVKASELFSMNLRTLKNGEVARSYIALLIVESSDPDAELPKKGEDPLSPATGRIDMRSVDQGQRSIPLSFLLRRQGPQTITVYDKLNPGLRETITINVLRQGGGGGDVITIIDPPDRSRIKGHTVMLQGRAPSLVNLKVKGGRTVIDTESDSEGIFRVNVELNPNNKESTLFVVSENGTYESAPIHVISDNEPPIIETASLNPPIGKTGDTTTITVKSEPELASVIATIKGTKVTLQETASGGGLYTGILTAPSDSGIIDVMITGTDSVGYETTLLLKWTIGMKDIPTVQDVRAENRPQEVTLSWKEITEMPVREYKIYIAEHSDPLNILYSVPTQGPSTTAVIKDLPLGKTYEFSVTMINPDGEESSEKSAPAIGMPLGLSLSVKPGNDSLSLEWTTIPDLPIDHYVLEYGIEPGVFLEHRDIDGAAVATILRDLINGIEYFVKLTPVTVTQKTLSELSVTASGTPDGKSFVATSADPIPDDLRKLHPAPNNEPSPSVSPVPRTPNSGISTVILLTLLAISVIGGLRFRRHRFQLLQAQEFLKNMDHRYHSS
jgi:hypothetical protein